jgi:gliding motility-associated-like protein
MTAGRSVVRFLPCFLLVLSMFPVTLHATHQRAAEITFRHVKDLTYEITLISYTFTPSPANAYRDYLTINWGDGTSSEIPRVQETYLPDDITYNKYIGTHDFPGASTYTISCEDPNRNGGIINIPNSINTPLFIYSELTINPFIGGYNNSPVLLIPPVDNGCVNQLFYHNPGAYDPDGDSLSYTLVPCRGALGQIIPGYTYPVGDVSFTLNAVTGDLIWDSPKQQGEYNIAILIEEWRNGVKIGSVLRDMQIIIVVCNNSPPVIDPIADTCIEAGKYLRFPVTARDAAGDKITLTATGGPFILGESPAIIDPDPAIANGVVQTLFKWNTVCNHIKINPYQVFFKAKDDAKPVSLVAFRSVRILVIGPAPKNLTATPIGNTITLNWDNYTCPNASGYDIYRKADSTGYIPGYCETGVPSYLGYSMIGRINNVTQTSYLDDNNGAGLTRGLKYCYLVVARYPDKAESYASNEACAALKKDLAVITNASINSTSETEGSIYVAWSKPTEIDPVQIPGPYKYIIARSRTDTPGQFVLVDSLNNLNDTVFTDNLLNTRDYSYYYRIDFYNVTPGNRFLVGSSQVASTLYLTANPTDNMNRLTWSNNVPWLNHLFVVYRKDPGGTSFDSIGQSAVPAYNDQGLTNGLSYCYLIKSIGKYSASGFVEPIINFSQEACGIPVDNVPPCPPLLSVETVCDVSSNQLYWAIPADTCGRDISGYRILFIQGYGIPVLIDSIMAPGDTSYLHAPSQSIAGCYGVIAVDSSGNASDTSNIVCVDYTACPAYRLPNVFTPNGDGKNDLFIPFPGYTSVAGVDMKIFDRWGRLVFDTDDPAINWDGKDKTTGQPCSDGVYFYVCDVEEITLSGLVTRNIHGSVTILR